MYVTINQKISARNMNFLDSQLVFVKVFRIDDTEATIAVAIAMSPLRKCRQFAWISPVEDYFSACTFFIGYIHSSPVM